MKRKTISRLLLAAALMAGTCSCSDYLNVQPQGKVLPKTDEEFASIMHNLINDIEGGFDCFVIGNMESIMQFEGFADNLDANIRTGSLPSYAGEKINKRQQDYRATFKIIKDCNIIIGNLEGRTTETAEGTLAAAYAMKGCCYYNLIRDFCEPWAEGNASRQMGLPIVEEFDIFATPVRSSLEETAQYTISLLEKSLSIGMDDPKYFFTEYVTKTYLAKLLFWIEDWEGCVTLCKDIYENSGISLTPASGYVEMIQSPKEKKGEVIVRSHINDANELDWYFSSLQTYIKSRPVKADLIHLFDQDKEKDVRFRICADKKRIPAKRPEFKVRMSEIVLMMSECHYHLGNGSDALKWLNLLRKNRIEGCVDLKEEDLPPTRSGDLITEDAEGKPVTPLLQSIFDERRKELFLEADRWFELKRNGRPEWWIISNGLKYTTRQYLYTAPLYKGDIDMNKGLMQNPGYIY